MTDKGIFNQDETVAADTGADNPNGRRTFLKWGGAGLAALALANADRVMAFTNPKTKLDTAATTISLGTGDVAVGNFAYLLEQLEADFYTRVVANNFYAGANANERQVLTDLRDHEIVHREFLKRLISNGSRIPDGISFNFSGIDFNSRDSVLGASQAMEDTGVGAYNGAGQLLTNADFLNAAGKIVSVEARHAAMIRFLRIPNVGYFAPHTEDFVLDYLEVLTLVSPFIPTGVVIDASGLSKTIVV